MEEQKKAQTTNLILVLMLQYEENTFKKVVPGTILMFLVSSSNTYNCELSIKLVWIFFSIASFSQNEPLQFKKVPTNVLLLGRDGGVREFPRTVTSPPITALSLYMDDIVVREAAGFNFLGIGWKSFAHR